MNLIRNIKNGNTNIEIYDSDLTETEKKENLKNLYRTINSIAKEQAEKGIDTSDWFYSKSELNSISNDKKYNFL